VLFERKVLIMNAKLVLAVAAFAAATAGVARADEADASQYAVKFEGNRTRAEVMAEAATVSATRSTEPAGSRIAAPLKSSLDAKTVRAQAAEAVRLGKISAGEASL
jgi:hypothetical protein